MIIYRIQRADGKWSRGGESTVAPTSYKRASAWTDKLKRAKVWKRKSDVNCHLTNIRTHCERYAKCPPPDDWVVVEFERTETRQGTIVVGKGMKV